MNDSTILIATSENYLPHAKALMVSCIRQGSWNGDFCLLCPKTCDTSSIDRRGIDVIRAPETEWTNAIKFRIFSPYFRKWKRLLYLDCDILIQGNLTKLCETLAKKFPAIVCDGSHDASILNDWIHFDPTAKENAHPEVYERLRTRFPHIDKKVLTSDAMCFSPKTIPDETVDKLYAIQQDFALINPGSYDQQVMNLLLYNQMTPMTKDHCTWFAFDDPGNRVVNEARGWCGDEEPTILHYWGMYAPWLVKQISPNGDEPGAYQNHRLGRVCHELYAENLAAFEEVFPLKP